MSALTVESMSELQKRAARLVAEGNVPHTLTDSTDASRWLVACCFEQTNRFQEAASLLDGIWNGYAGEERATLLLAYARDRSRTGETPWPILAEAAKATSSYRTLAAVDRLIARGRKSEEPPARRRYRIALLGSITAELWVPALRAQCYRSGIDATVHVAPFGQYEQEILDARSHTAAFHPDIVVIALDWRALNLPDESAEPEAVLQDRLMRLQALWQACRQRLNAQVVQFNCEIPQDDPFGRLSAVLPGGRGRLIREFNLRLFDAERQQHGVTILDVEQIASGFGKDQWFDPVLWSVAKQYPSAQAIPALTHALSATIRAALGLSYKCVVLDLDGTLWGGVIGEDGLQGIQVSDAHIAFQRYLKSLASRGVLLAACSKNNLEDALLPFTGHRDMVLKREDFSAFAANWNSKADNIRGIARELNIGLDSIVFVDDNPMERAAMRAAVPEVEVVELPADTTRYVRALDAPLYFEALTLTAEDRARGQSMRQNAERLTLQAQASTPEEYLAGLQMKVALTACDEVDLARVVQLINKTNQFNLTTRRRNESEVRLLMKEAYTQILRLQDRFGDSGLTAVLIAVPEGCDLRIDTWLMSCRVMGRKLEEVMFASLLRHARALGCKRVIGEYLPTAKNIVVADLYAKLGLQQISEGLFVWDTLRNFQAPQFIETVDQTLNIGNVANV